MKKQHGFFLIVLTLSIFILCSDVSFASHSKTEQKTHQKKKSAGLPGATDSNTAVFPDKALAQEVENLFKRVGEAAGPAVVLLRSGQGGEADETSDVLGSGCLISAKGYILTTEQTIKPAAGHISVTLADQREFKATLIGTDPKTDLAVLQIEGDHFPAAVLGDSDAVKAGDWGFAIGGPFEQSQEVTPGIIKVKARSGLSIINLDDFIQVEMTFHHIQGGGPFVNRQGEVLGINAAVGQQGTALQGMVFVIPVKLAEWVAERLIAEGTVVRGTIGVVMQSVTPAIATAFGLEEAKGALIGDVLPGSPAEQAGITRGDVIITLNGQMIETADTLRRVVAECDAGQQVPVVIIRDGQRQTIQVMIAEQP
jgi:S1-C subfamily serine protease